MATYRAVGATCEAVVRLLQQSWRRDMFNNTDLRFEVYRTGDFATPMDAGVSLFLFRVAVNSVQRTPPAKPGPRGRQRRPQLPLDLHFLLTPWAKDASLEQVILGWMMRALEDTPILPAGLLNTLLPDVFDADETVEIVVGQMPNEEMFRIWDVLPNDYQISIPYMARIVRIDSELDMSEAGPVVTRELDLGVLKDV
ncbi:MAG: hypothetical protein NVS4B11_29420 [Ktedonobacteraceae bacterium]